MESVRGRYAWVRFILIAGLQTFLLFTCIAQQHLYKTQDGSITFISDAPLEVITATSKKMEGVIDANAMSFAFSVAVQSFEGFNNGLQQEHFYENYMETDKYPVATFSGKIIEQVNFLQPGTYVVRAKGQLKIHGISKERILKTEVISNGSTLKVKTDFLIPLADHQIEVPRIVNQKIAQEIAVTVQASLSQATKP
jgi:hypothetical protein